TMVVFCDMVRDSSWPNALRNAGARMASVNVVEEGREGLLMAEGHPDTLRALRGVFARERSRLVEVLPDTKAVYLAGIEMASRLLLPWIDGAPVCLGAAGLSRREATELMESRRGRMPRVYVNAGRVAWNRRTAASLRKTLERDVEALAAVD